MTLVRWGIVGPGRIAHQFAKDIMSVDNARLVAVAARDGASLSLLFCDIDHLRTCAHA